MTCCIASISSLMPRPQHEQANEEVQEFYKEIVVEQIDAIAAAHQRRRFIPIYRMKPASARRGRSHGSGEAGFATRAVRQTGFSSLYVLAAVCEATGAM